jgi:hypothetical protein
MESTVMDVVEVVVVEHAVAEPTVTDSFGGVDTRDVETIDDDEATVDAVGGAELLDRESVGWGRRRRGRERRRHGGRRRRRPRNDG